MAILTNSNHQHSGMEGTKFIKYVKNGIKLDEKNGILKRSVTALCKSTCV